MWPTSSNILTLLTNKGSLPIISAEAAVILMEHEQRLCIDSESTDRNNESTCLQNRCIDSLVDGKTGCWKVTNPIELLQKKLQGMPRSVLESLLLRKMNDIKQPSIRVSGAGCDFVNGIYTISGLHEGYPMFTKSVPYKGKHGLFCIYTNGSPGHFWISLVPEGGILDGDEKDFYVSINRRNEWPQEDDWEVSNFGQRPTPTVRFVYNM